MPAPSRLARGARALRTLRPRMPASLRARLLAGVLVLSAAGLLVVGAVTYSDQRSFLEGRVDEQAHAAVGAISQQLDRNHDGPPAYSSEQEPPAPGGGRRRKRVW
jgi:two-component system OmpR family sensor kinase